MDELVIQIANEATIVLSPVPNPVGSGKMKARRKRAKRQMMARRKKCRRKTKTESGKIVRNGEYVRGIQRNQEYCARQMCRNNFEGSCDENDISEAAEDESTFDDHGGDEVDYATNSSFSGNDLSVEKRERFYNPACLYCSCDENDISDAAEDESTFDDHGRDEVDYATDASFSGNDLSVEEEEQIYNLVCVADEYRNIHR
nr:transcription initiation factor TFIIF subunit [Hymenolepis microstoma]